jgi:hypothetical protein
MKAQQSPNRQEQDPPTPRLAARLLTLKVVVLRMGIHLMVAKNITRRDHLLKTPMHWVQVATLMRQEGAQEAKE